jgi:peptidoglycan hydrolase-like protein with peptidoglycan-binding domain
MKIIVTENQLEFLVKKLNNNKILKESYSKETMIIGDSIGYFLSKKLNLSNDIILSKENNYTTKDLLFDLEKNDKPKEEIKNLIISIGSGNLFLDAEYVTNICELIYELFPNANYYVIEGFISLENAEKLDEKQKIDLEFLRESYYDKFPNDIFTIIDSGDLISREEIEINSPKISFILNQTLRYININTDEIKIQNKEIQKDIKKKEVIDSEKINFINLSIDEREEYDELNEFLDLLEKMIKSNNIYDKNLKNKYLGDVEIIQAALKFLDLPYSDDMEIDGYFNDDTENVVKQYQKIVGLPDDGIVNNKFLEKLLFDLEVKDFNEEELSTIFGKIGLVKHYEPDNIDLVELCDNIIDNLEGGYANEAHFKKNIDKVEDPDTKQALLNSGETMFGIDRKNGPTMTEFWEIVDENSGWAKESVGKEKWKHGYMGGSVEDDLRDKVYEWAIPTFEDFKNNYLDSETKRIVGEDKRITTHLLYGVWNGIVMFKEFANELNDAVSNGITDRDELWEVAINSRRNYSNGLIRKKASEVEKVANL